MGTHSMTRRFSAQRQTIIRDLVKVMRDLEATSLTISEQNLLDDSDVSVSITFDRAGIRYISKCNTWDHFADNLRAAQLAISYTWRIVEGYGVEYLEERTMDEMLQKVFGWLEAPLDPNILLLGSGDNWWEILDVDPNSTSKAAIVNRFRTLSKVHHPDVNKKKGSADEFIKLQEAYEEGIKSLD